MEPDVLRERLVDRVAPPPLADAEVLAEVEYDEPPPAPVVVVVVDEEPGRLKETLDPEGV